MARRHTLTFHAQVGRRQREARATRRYASCNAGRIGRKPRLALRDSFAMDDELLEEGGAVSITIRTSPAVHDRLRENVAGGTARFSTVRIRTVALYGVRETGSEPLATLGVSSGGACIGIGLELLAQRPTCIDGPCLARTERSWTEDKCSIEAIDTAVVERSRITKTTATRRRDDQPRRQHSANKDPSPHFLTDTMRVALIAGPPISRWTQTGKKPPLSVKFWFGGVIAMPPGGMVHPAT